MSRRLVSNKHYREYWTKENLRTVRSCFARNQTMFLTICKDEQRAKCEAADKCLERATYGTIAQCRKVRIDIYAFARKIATRLTKRKKRAK